MHKYTLVFQHSTLAAVRVAITVDSPERAEAVRRDAAMLIEEVDEFADAAGFEGMADYWLKSITSNGIVVVEFKG